MDMLAARRSQALLLWLLDGMCCSSEWSLALVCECYTVSDFLWAYFFYCNNRFDIDLKGFVHE